MQHVLLTDCMGVLCSAQNTLLLVNCDLRKLDRGLAPLSHERAQTLGRPSLLQLFDLIPYLMRPWSKYEPFFFRHVPDDKKDSITQRSCRSRPAGTPSLRQQTSLIQTVSQFSIEPERFTAFSVCPTSHSNSLEAGGCMASR